MEKWKKRSIDLITAIAFGSKSGTPSVIPYYPQKTDISSYEARNLSRSVPEKHGVSSKRLYSMLCELEAERRANIHSLMVIKDGVVISECSRDGYDVNTWHLSHSMSKTVTGMAIGMLVDDGLLKLSEKLVKIFPEVEYKDKRFASITVEHLLSMTSGVAFSEAGTVTEYDWTEAFFSSSMKFAPGADFAYNSMNSYILAKIVTRVAKKSLTSLLEERLFAPLEIKNYFWEIGPEQVEKGGWGLYFSAESWAKIGIMLASGGVYFGRRILSEEWVKRATSSQAVAPAFNGDFNYGYQLWVGKNTDEVLLNGMLGQNVWICPRNNIVVVLLCGNNELFQASPALEIIRKYLGHEMNDAIHHKDAKLLGEKEKSFFDCRRWVTPLEKKRGFMYWLGLKSRTVYDERWDDVLGEYRFGKNNIGILPLVVRGMQNNLDARLESLHFERQGDELYICFYESRIEYRVEVGLYEYRTSVLDFRGEKYITRVMGEVFANGEGDVEYRIEFLFPELPNTRMIRIKKTSQDMMRFELSEIPNNKIVDSLVSRATVVNPPLGFAVDLLERRFGDGFIEQKVSDTFNPTLIGANVASEQFESIIAAENARAAEESKFVRVLRAVVDRFFKENDDDAVLVEKATVQKIPKTRIGDIINKVRLTIHDVKSKDNTSNKK